jgi:hypothetical protein
MIGGMMAKMEIFCNVNSGSLREAPLVYLTEAG